MKALANLLLNVNVKHIKGAADILISGITSDSREVKAGSMFFAVKGTRADGHNFIAQVIENGAVAIVCETVPESTSDKITYIQVDNSSYQYVFCRKRYQGRWPQLHCSGN